MSTLVAEPEMISFNAAERCDRCGAQAHAKAEKGDSELLFCGHHMRLHHAKLLDDGFTVIDDGEIELPPLKKLVNK